ncbi:MAG: tRNA (adenosine(37)-N6)-threonylcarbamoyltransferase complex dimerization subunit type 1 TsaB [Spirochaetaceae bacterium]|jgi:tRNA threonylcarbamoyladenosine biosynthesis protein TsaB|nr:tRNA (adenosine(37)-N6)-threonylcarbamoyltransferase complex dimerization subunit type 1 TsaB [Spirochaetaceae bacterium]
MNTLAMDCSTEILSLTLETEKKLLTIDRKEGLKHSENLMPTIDWLFNQASLQKKDLDLIVCSMGPGSFTGLRIAVATAKALALGCQASWVMVSNLDCYGKKLDFFNGLVVPIIDAKKQCYYSAFYQQGRIMSPYMDITSAKLYEKLQGHQVLFTGPHYSLLKENCPLEKVFWDDQGNQGISPILLELGKNKFHTEGGDSLDIGPLYLRKSEAEIAAGM